MTANWHYARGGEKHGPITAAQLKELATTGQIAPDDLVWREDMKEWRKASTVKGLLPDQPTATPQKPPQPEVAKQNTNGEAIAVWERPAILALSLICCYPVGLFLLWKHPRMSTGQKTLWTAACGVVIVLLLVFNSFMTQSTKTDLARAQTLWDKGQKAEAVAIYQSILAERDMFLSDTEKAVVYGRVIDHFAEKGDEDEVRSMLEKLNRTVPKITPLVESADGKRILAKIEAEEQRKQEQEALAEAARHPMTLDKSERADFLDNTASYKGKAIKFECEWIGGGLRSRSTGRMTVLELDVWHSSGLFHVNVRVPEELDIPNIQKGDDLVVTFLCAKGLLNTGNTALKVERRP